MPAKASIVFAHGIWADGSCFSKVIPPLQAEGHQVIASQHSLDTLEGDVATARGTIGRVSSPVLAAEAQLAPGRSMILAARPRCLIFCAR
jgi:hypothetical protein